MDKSEVVKLLILAMAYDNRKPGDAAVSAWQDVANRERWTFEAAAQAIKEHYAESTEFLMPAHVTQRLRSRRALPPPVRQIQNRITSADPQHIRATVKWLADRLNWKSKEKYDDQRSDSP